MEDGAKLSVLIDGREQDWVTSISMDTDGGKIPIYTLKQGFTGMSPGPGHVKLTLGYAVPVGGFEENFSDWVCNLGRHTLQIMCGALAYVGEGEFMTDKLSQSAQSALEGTVDWMGQKKSFQ